MTESLLLAGLGSAAGLGLAFGLIRLLQVLRPDDLPRLETLAVDVAGSLLLGRVLARFLYDIEPGDPGTLGLVFTVLLAAALAASYLPARRVARVDPAWAVRGDGGP